MKLDQWKVYRTLNKTKQNVLYLRCNDRSKYNHIAYFVIKNIYIIYLINNNLNIFKNSW